MYIVYVVGVSACVCTCVRVVRVTRESIIYIILFIHLIFEWLSRYNKYTKKKHDQGTFMALRVPSLSTTKNTNFVWTQSATIFRCRKFSLNIIMYYVKVCIAVCLWWPAFKTPHESNEILNIMDWPARFPFATRRLKENRSFCIHRSTVVAFQITVRSNRKTYSTALKDFE